jgi:hypothetical protein
MSLTVCLSDGHPPLSPGWRPSVGLPQLGPRASGARLRGDLAADGLTPGEHLCTEEAPKAVWPCGEPR